MCVCERERETERQRDRERDDTLPHLRVYIGLLTHEKTHKQEDVSVCVRTHTH